MKVIREIKRDRRRCLEFVTVKSYLLKVCGLLSKLKKKVCHK
jgi:hypothetical protein